MAKFVMECPNCGNRVEANNGIFGLFGTKKVRCSCKVKVYKNGNVVEQPFEFEIKNNKLASKDCPYCGNQIVYDRTKGDKAQCPVCHKKINGRESMMNLVNIFCPSCSCSLTVRESDEGEKECVLCGARIDLKREIKKIKEKNSGLASVIKYEGENDVFVWKHPIEDFNLGSQLIVHESQEAVFFRDGRALDTFQKGKYLLETQALPIMEKLYSLPLNNREVFHSEIYFINLTTQMNIRWGTNSKIRVFDPGSGMHVELGARGFFNLRVCDSRKLLMRLVGTTSEFTREDFISTTGKDELTGQFKSLIVNKVKTNLAKMIREEQIDLLQVDEHIDILSERLKEIINQSLETYGFVMPEFFIAAIETPDDDNWRELRQQYADRVLEIRKQSNRAQIIKAEREAKIAEIETENELKKLEMEREKLNVQGEAERLMIKANAEAMAERERERVKLELELARGNVEADVMRARGSAEAETYGKMAESEAKEMAMKNFNYEMQTRREIGLEAMQNGLTGGSGQGNGTLGELASLGVTLGTVGSVMGITKEAIKPIMEASNEVGRDIGNIFEDDGVWDCPKCGKKKNNSKFCGECGMKKPSISETWDCKCGNKGIQSKFCGECGAKRGDFNE